MVADVKAKQAKALLITPVVRRHFDDEGKLRDMHGIYPSLVREVSQEQNVPLMDLFKISSEYILSLGVKDSIDHFVHIGPGIHNCCAEGRLDNTHFTQKGAKAMAELVIKTVKQQGPKELAECF
jgi:lysophospholipase L1-like esterase